MRVVDIRDQKFLTTCENCEAILEYEISDLRYDEYYTINSFIQDRKRKEIWFACCKCDTKQTLQMRDDISQWISSDFEEFITLEKR